MPVPICRPRLSSHFLPVCHNAPWRVAHPTAASCGSRRSTFRRVLEYFPQSTFSLSAMRSSVCRGSMPRMAAALRRSCPASAFPSQQNVMVSDFHSVTLRCRTETQICPPQVLQTASRTGKNRKKMNKYAENASRRPVPGLSPVSRKRTSPGKKKAGPTKKHQNGKPSKPFFPPPPARLLRKKARTAFGIHVFCLPLPYGTAGTSIHGERPLGRNRVHRLRHRPTAHWTRTPRRLKQRKQ